MAGKQMFCGVMEQLFEAELRAIERDRLLHRLWKHDATLWPYGEWGPKYIRENLEFLHFPDLLPKFMAGGLNANREAGQEGMTEKLLISFGSVHHFCKAALDVHPEGKSLAFWFLKSCHPDALRRVEQECDPLKMFIILVNKSNYQLEDHSLFLHFHKKIAQVSGQNPGKHFVAATDPGSYLAAMAAEYGFRYLLEMPADVPAAYCSVLFLALFLAGAMQFEPEVLRIAGREMKKQFAEAPATGENTACELAAFLSASAKSGRKILRFVAGPALASFASAVCPLVGGSLGRGDGGLYPLVSAASRGGEAKNDQASYILLRKSAEEEPGLEACKERLKRRGTPFLETGISNPLDLLRKTYEWQVATLLCASRLGIDPLGPPDTLRAQSLAGEMLGGLSSGSNTLQRKPRVQEGPLRLFAEEKARREISQLNVIESLRSFFQGGRFVSYLGLFVFLEQQEETERFFEGMCTAMEKKLSLPVLLAWGPRSIYTYSYLLRREAPAGLHLVVTGDPKTDLRAPGASYTFGQIYLALALGQFETLSMANGLALRVHVGGASEEELARLDYAVSQALPRVAL